MKRSSSASIVSDKGFVGPSLSSSQSVIFRSSSVSCGLESEPYLPTFNPSSHAAEKKRRHLKLAKIFIHSIPFIVVFCAIVLWLFSDPGTEITQLQDARRSRSTIWYYRWQVVSIYYFPPKVIAAGLVNIVVDSNGLSITRASRVLKIIGNSVCRSCRLHVFPCCFDTGNAWLLNRANKDWWGSCCESVMAYRKPLKDLKVDRENCVRF